MKNKRNTLKIVIINVEGQAPQFVKPVKGKIKTTFKAFFSQFADMFNEAPLPTSKETKS